MQVLNKSVSMVLNTKSTMSNLQQGMGEGALLHPSPPRFQRMTAPRHSQCVFLPAKITLDVDIWKTDGTVRQEKLPRY